MVEAGSGILPSIRDRVFSEGANRIKVEGPGVEYLNAEGPMIIATTHMTDLDPQYAIAALTERLGGMENVRIAHSSSHRSWKRPELKIALSVVEKLVGKGRIIPISYRYSQENDPKTGQAHKYDRGALNPKDWKNIIKRLKNKERLFTAAYYEDSHYFALPKRSGYLPLVLQHHVSQATLLPVVVLFPQEVYKKQQHIPTTPPKIIVCEPISLKPLAWFSSEKLKQIQEIFPDFQGKPVDFFEMVLQERRSEEFTKLDRTQRELLREEFGLIKTQLRQQSEQLMLALGAHVPDELKPKQDS